jgi:hypothetical protein
MADSILNLSKSQAKLRANLSVRKTGVIKSLSLKSLIARWTEYRRIRSRRSRRSRRSLRSVKLISRIHWSSRMSRVSRICRACRACRIWANSVKSIEFDRKYSISRVDSISRTRVESREMRRTATARSSVV